MKLMVCPYGHDSPFEPGMTEEMEELGDPFAFHRMIRSARIQCRVCQREFIVLSSLYTLYFEGWGPPKHIVSYHTAYEVDGPWIGKQIDFKEIPDEPI